MNLRRRGFLAGLGIMLAAPAIIRPGLLMPVKPVLIVPATGIGFPIHEAGAGALYRQAGGLVDAFWKMGTDGRWRLAGGAMPGGFVYTRALALNAFDLGEQTIAQADERMVRSDYAKHPWFNELSEPEKRSIVASALINNDAYAPEDHSAVVVGRHAALVGDGWSAVLREDD